MKKIDPPEPRKHEKRLTADMKAIKPGEHLDLKIEDSRCLRSFGRYNHWKMVERNMGSFTRIWRIS